MGDNLYLEVALSDGKIRVPEIPEAYKIFRLVENFMSQDMSKHALLQLDPSFTVGALLTGREMIGVLIVGPSIIDSTELIRVYHQMAVGMQHLELIHHEQELIEVLNRNNLRLSRESEHDMLTGVFNRRGFMNNLEQRINHVIMYDKSNSKAAIFYMDMDGLKQINDTYGHDEGDFAIRNSADILSKAFGNGLVGRQGGDEFLGFCLLDGSVVEEPENMITKVDKLMEEFNTNSGKPYKLRISIGYMEFLIDFNTIKNLPSYMESADTMLYENKRKRKGLK
jgi:diguanylate cyclase (GGDEF)-like protein